MTTNDESTQEEKEPSLGVTMMTWLFVSVIGLLVLWSLVLAFGALVTIAEKASDPLSDSIQDLDMKADLLSREYPDATYFAITGIDHTDDMFTPPPAAEVDVPRQNVFTVAPGDNNDQEAHPHNFRLIMGNSPQDYKYAEITFPDGINIQLVRDETHDKGEYTFRVWRGKEEAVTRIQYRKQ